MSRQTACTLSASPLRTAFCLASFVKSRGILTSVTAAPSIRRANAATGGTDTGTEIDGVNPRLRGRRCREQDRIVTDTVAAQRLSQDEPAAEDGVLAHPADFSGHLRAQLVGEACFRKKPSRGGKFVIADQDAAREDADPTFKNAHVLIDHHMVDMRTFKQRLDRRDQHGIVGANEFAHANSGAALRPARAAPDRQ